MSLIEHMDKDDWKDTLRRTFEYVLHVMKNDRFRHVASSADDLRAWLGTGGVSRVEEQLNRQMRMLGYPEAKITEVNAFLEQLVKENRIELLDLIARGEIPQKNRELLSTIGFTEQDFGDLLERMIKGERPFEDWMYAHGHTDKEIQEIYSLIDDYLLKHGIISPPDKSDLH